MRFIAALLPGISLSSFAANAAPPQVGTLTFAANAANSATLTYSVNGVSVTKTVERQRFKAADVWCDRDSNRALVFKAPWMRVQGFFLWRRA